MVIVAAKHGRHFRATRLNLSAEQVVPEPASRSRWPGTATPSAEPLSRLTNETQAGEIRAVPLSRRKTRFARPADLRGGARERQDSVWRPRRRTCGRRRAGAPHDATEKIVWRTTASEVRAARPGATFASTPTCCRPRTGTAPFSSTPSRSTGGDATFREGGDRQRPFVFTGKDDDTARRRIGRSSRGLTASRRRYTRPWRRHLPFLFPETKRW